MSKVKTSTLPPNYVPLSNGNAFDVVIPAIVRYKYNFSRCNNLTELLRLLDTLNLTFAFDVKEIPAQTQILIDEGFLIKDEEGT